MPRGFFEDKIFKKLRRLAGGDTYTIIYLKMLLCSLESQGYLYIDGLEETSAEEIALEIDERPEDVAIALGYFCKVGLAELGTDSVYMSALPEMVGSETQAAKRMREMRKRNNVRISDGSVRERYTDIDIDKDKEIYIECVQGTPTLEQVKNYCLEIKSSIDPVKFYDHYTANGWTVNGQPVKDWRARVRVWEQGDKERKPKNKFNNFNQRKNDYGNIEKALMAKRLNNGT